MSGPAAGFENNKIIDSLLAGTAITYARFVTVEGEEDLNHTAAGGRVDGVAYLPQATVGQPVSLAVDGIVMLECGGAVSDGAPLISGANGRAVVSPDENCYAVALGDGETGSGAADELRLG